MNVKVKFGHSGGDEERVVKFDSSLEDLILEYASIDAEMPQKNVDLVEGRITLEEFKEWADNFFTLQRRVKNLLPSDWRIRHYLHIEVL